MRHYVSWWDCVGVEKYMIDGRNCLWFYVFFFIYKLYENLLKLVTYNLSCKFSFEFQVKLDNITLISSRYRLVIPGYKLFHMFKVKYYV